MAKFVGLEPHQELYRRNVMVGRISLSIYNALRLEYNLSAIEAHHLAMLFADVNWISTITQSPVICDNCHAPMANTRKRHGYTRSYHICPKCLAENED